MCHNIISEILRPDVLLGVHCLQRWLRNIPNVCPNCRSSKDWQFVNRRHGGFGVWIIGQQPLMTPITYWQPPFPGYLWRGIYPKFPSRHCHQKKYQLKTKWELVSSSWCWSPALDISPLDSLSPGQQRPFLQFGLFQFHFSVNLSSWCHNKLF